VLVCERSSNAILVKLKGELDHRNAGHIREELDEMLSDEKIRRLILDLNGLEFMDSSGIGVILGRYRLMQKRGGSVCVKNRNRAVDRILDVAGLYRIVEKID